MVILRVSNCPLDPRHNVIALKQQHIARVRYLIHFLYPYCVCLPKVWLRKSLLKVRLRDGAASWPISIDRSHPLLKDHIVRSFEYEECWTRFDFDTEFSWVEMGIRLVLMGDGPCFGSFCLDSRRFSGEALTRGIKVLFFDHDEAPHEVEIDDSFQFHHTGAICVPLEALIFEHTKLFFYLVFKWILIQRVLPQESFPRR